jgi:hypothetical protein
MVVQVRVLVQKQLVAAVVRDTSAAAAARAAQEASEAAEAVAAADRATPQGP